MSYYLNIYLNYILNETVADKDPLWMCGWNKNCAIKWKNNAYCKEYDTYLKMHIIANLLFLYIWTL